MPAQYGKDSKGNWVRWGTQGAKYYYKKGDDASKNRALAKMNAQRKAIKANQ